AAAARTQTETAQANPAKGSRRGSLMNDNDGETSLAYEVAASLTLQDQLPLLFQPNEVDERLKAIAEDIQELKVSSMTPLAALNKISEWQQKLS
ncbi:MAG: hypothetical protein AABZ31_12230, partial [Bdellovibrionota bacterium]